MKFKMLLLLAVLCAASTLAANSIDYDTGAFKSGSLSGSFSSMINVDITGSLHTIDIQTGTLVKTTAGCPPGSTCYSFTGGSVTVDGTVFKDALNGGITVRESGAASILATLMPEAGVSSGTASASFDFSNKKLTSGSEDVAYNTTVTPEPATLMLFGSGLIGIVVKFRKHRNALQWVKD